MSPVRRRSPRPKKRWLVPALLIAALAALTVLWLALRKPAPVLPDPVVAQPAVLSNREAGEIAGITIANPYDAPYTLTQDAEGWHMADDPDFVFSESTLNAIVDNAALVAVEDTVGDLNDHPEWQLMNYGLDEDAVRVEVAFADGSRLAFRVGDPVPQEAPAYYFLLEGDSHVYITGMDVFEAYTYTRVGLHAVTDPALKGDLIDRVCFAGENAFTAERRPDGWYLTEPFVYPLSDAAVSSLLTKLEGVRFAQYIGRADQVDLAGLGLDPPRRRLTIEIAASTVTGYDAQDQATGSVDLPAYTLTFDVGSEENEILFNCLYRGEAVKATVFSAGFMLTQQYDSLLLTAPFNAPTNDLYGLMWRQEGAEMTYQISLQERVLPNNEFEKDESGSILHDVVVMRDGSPVDSDAFLTAYGQLLDLRTQALLPQDWQIPQGEAALTVIVTRSAASRRVDFYPLDPLHWAVAVDGKAIYQVERDWAQGILWP